MKEYNKFAIVSLVLGILIFVDLYNLEKAIAAVIFGVLAITQIRKNTQSGRPMAIAGIVLGIIFLLIIVFLYLRA